MSLPGQYDFLNLYHEGEAVARGANLMDKVNHAVFKAIQAASSVNNARSNNLFNVKTQIPDIINLDARTKVVLLGRLIGDGVIAQIFRLDYNAEMGGTTLEPCFIAHRAEDSDELGHLYSETVLRSAQSLEFLIAARTPVSRKAIQHDLQFDFDSEKDPEIEKFAASIVNLFGSVHASKFDVLPSPDMVKCTIQDIQEEIVKRGKVVDILNYGLMPFKEQELLDRIECAREFLHTKILPRYKSRASLKQHLDLIRLEEATHDLDEHAAPTTQFDLRRAEAVKQAVLSNPGSRAGGSRFPGSLAIESLLVMGDAGNKQLAEKHKLTSLGPYEEYKQILMEAGSDWRQALLTFNDEERLELPPESWRNLVDDLELYYRTWQTPYGTQHAFIRRDAGVFRVLVRGMGELSVEQRWQILAMKSILEENDTEMPGLFDDPEFVSAYGQLLRSVYMQEIPWLYRILMLFGFRFAQDAGFKIAKQRIQEKQNRLTQINQIKTEEIIKQKDVQRRKARDQIQNVAQAGKIVEKLDWFYLTRNMIPSIGDVRQALSEMGLQEFENILENSNFQQVSVGTSGTPGENILLYPLDSSWHVKLARLRRVVDKIQESVTHSQENPIQSNRVRALEKYLARAKESATQSVAEQGATDEVYQKFGEEVEKVKDLAKSTETDALEDQAPATEVSAPQTPYLDDGGTDDIQFGSIEDAGDRPAGDADEDLEF